MAKLVILTFEDFEAARSALEDAQARLDGHSETTSVELVGVLDVSIWEYEPVVGKGETLTGATIDSL